MQVTTISDAQACPKDSGRAAGGLTNSGEFDLAMAALCAILSPVPVDVALRQSSSGNETTSLNETGNLKLADPTVFFADPKTAAAEKKPADNEAAGLNIENAVQTLAGVANTVDMLNNPALQQNPAMIMAPVQNPQTAVLPFTGAGSTVQQSTNLGVGAVSTQSPVVADNVKGFAPVFDSSAQLTGTGSAAQQSINPGVGAVSTQSPVIADNAKGFAPAYSAATQPEPGAAPQEALSVKASVVVEPSQKGVQLPPEMVVLSQGQLNQVVQEPAPKNKQKTTLMVAATDEREQAKEDEQSGMIKTGSLGSISANEKPALNGTLPAAKPTTALSLNQTDQPDGKEVQPGPGKDGAVVTLSESKTAATGEKTSNSSQHSAAQLNPTQSSSLAQFDQSLPLQSTGDVSKGVGLPDLKDRLVQEIKHFFTTYKGEPQTQVQLKLEPENLGQLTIKLYFNKGELSAHFYTGNSYVKDVLEGSLQQLRDTLGQQDMRLNEALVFTGDGGRGGGYSFSERNGREMPAYGEYNHRTYGGAQSKPLDLVSTEVDSSRVNYLI